MKNSMLLIGGCNIDFIATSKDKLIKRVSNIGEVSVSNGGVMRNIAENLARLGNDVDFITAIGNDDLGKSLKAELINLGIKLYCPETNLPTGSFVAINDANHDLAEAICDNRIDEVINVDFLKANKELIEKHDVILIDTNITQETIDYLFENYPNKKYMMDAISPTKVLKVKKYLDKFYLIKCNIHEATALMGIDLANKDLTSGLLARGAQKVVVSHGSNDIYFGEDLRKIDFVHVEEVFDFVNTIGCGDALTSGIVDHVLGGKSLKESVAFGNELARVTLMSKSATTPEISKFKGK